MKPRTLPAIVSLGVLGLLTVVATTASAADWTAGMSEGKPAFKSMGPLTFGPDGVLFVADTRSAAVVAVATGDTSHPAGPAKGLKVEGVDQKIAALLGTAADQITLNDMAVNPTSQNIYLAVSRGRGPDAIPVLMRVSPAGQIEQVKLDAVKFSRAELPDAPADAPAAAEGQRRPQASPRQESITDLAFVEDRLIVAGLSNEEFASTLRVVPFPFKTVAGGTSVEMYHGSHGRFETRSPVRTLVPMTIGAEPSILAAYTCTPLVRFPVKELVPGAKIRGKTIAELGAGNRPIDMIIYEKDGRNWLLLANSSRGVMKISTEGIDTASIIDEPVRGTKGLAYETIKEWTGVQHLDKLDGQNCVVLRRAGNGGPVTLEELPLP